MPLVTDALCHHASFMRLITDRLPELLAARLPLVDYRVTETSRYTFDIRVTLATSAGDVTVNYQHLPQPDERGIFEIAGERRLALALADHADLDQARIQCVGEHLYTYMETRLGEAPSELPWDASLARIWLPLEQWFHDSLTEPWYTQPLDETNWLAQCEHLRTLFIVAREKVFTPSQMGRVCPYQKPEGPNLRHIRRIVVGATIENERLIVADTRLEAGFSVAALMIPFIEHDELARVLMGTNMMRQWLPPREPEPALIQTGHEPASPAFWSGRNLLTTFMAWDTHVLEDGIVISESCAARLQDHDPIEIGDKISNRHGTKGVISQILPDADMPHLPDGTPVELIYSCMGVPTRGTLGQLREATMSRVAIAEGDVVIVPPFQAPSASQFRARLARAGLSENGMTDLTQGPNGPQFARPTTVGWVYWGRILRHRSRAQMDVTGEGTDVAQGADNAQVTGPAQVLGSAKVQGELEYYTLRDLQAYENLVELFHTRSSNHPTASQLADRALQDSSGSPEPPTPIFTDVQRRLALAGICMTWSDDHVTFRFAFPKELDRLELAQPVRHPWLRDRMMTHIGLWEHHPEYQALRAANHKVARMLASQAPKRLIDQAQTQLDEHEHTFVTQLVAPHHLRLGDRVRFSGRGVGVPDGTLHFDQVGLPEEMAWTLYEPHLAHALGSVDEVRQRSQHASTMLDKLMAQSWVVLNRRPTAMPTHMVAFHPVRRRDAAIHLHPFACPLMQIDFDGDSLAVFLPLSPKAQREAAQRLSITAHVERDPDLIRSLIPTHDAMWGLAAWSQTPSGLDAIQQRLGTRLVLPDGFVSRAILSQALRQLLAQNGVHRALACLNDLMQCGFNAAKASGASINPFFGTSVECTPPPQPLTINAWEAYLDELAERIVTRTDYEDRDLGVQLLAMKSGARTHPQHFLMLLGGRSIVVDRDGRRALLCYGLSDGLPPQAVYDYTFQCHEGLGQVLEDWQTLGLSLRADYAPQGFNVLARALRSQRPGIVFARAAAIEEVDPLTDIDSRLFVGLPPDR